MGNIFLNEIKKHKFTYGVIISLVTAIILIIQTLEFTNIIKEDWTWLLLAGVIFISLFGYYVNIIEKGREK
tara:strand:- start:241 stop:453 length:213 start_codon:yes stop_codon:yes gene_type:complete